MDLCLPLGILAFGLLIVMLVGHGLWVLVALIFRRGRSRQVVDHRQIAEAEIHRLRMQLRIDDATCKTVLDALAGRSQQPESNIPLANLQPPPLPVAAPMPPLATVNIAAEAATPVDPPLVDLTPRPAPAEPTPVPPPPPPPPPKPPRKPLSEVFAAFMESRNIRWGELVGGLLIVGCSVALVLSLWSEISQRPVLKFAVFNLVTAALFGLGLYSHHRWRLPMTSRGILVTATLLVPLTFLASAAFSAARVDQNALSFLGQVFSLLLAGWLLWLSGRVIAEENPLWLTAAVIGPSVALLALGSAAGHITAAATMPLLAWAAAPIACYQFSVACPAIRLWRQPQLPVASAHSILRLLGIATFAAILPLGLLIHKAGADAVTFRALAPLLCLLGLPVLGIGLLVWRRSESPDSISLTIAGATLAIIGALVLLTGIPLAWPAPGPMAATALLDFLLLACIAQLLRTPAAHLPADICLMLAYLLGVHLIRGDLAQNADSRALIAALASDVSAIALIPMSLALAALAGAFRRAGRNDDARFVAIPAALAAAASIALAARDIHLTGPGSPLAAGVFGFYAAAAFAVAWQLSRPQITWLAWALLLAALQQSQPHPADAWLNALLIEASIAAIVALLAKRIAGRLAAVLAPSAGATAAVTSWAALVPLFFSLSLSTCNPSALRILWIAALWGAISLLADSALWFAAAQAALTAAALLAVTGRLAQQRWFNWQDARIFQAYGATGAALGACWGIARLAGLRRWTAKWSVDRLVSVAALLLLVMLALAACVPGIAEEFALTSPIDPAWHNHAAGAGSWILLAALFIAAAGELLATPDAPRGVLLAVVAFTACPLLAARWEAQHATASALRWIAGIYLLLSIAPHWTRRRWPPSAVIGEFILISGATIVLLLTLAAALLHAGGQPLLLPAAGSFFRSIGPNVSYLFPLILTIAALLARSLMERSSAYAFAAGIVVNLTVTLGYLLGAVPPISLTTIIQSNVLATAAFALAWMGAQWLGKTEQRPRLLIVQIWAAVIGLLLLALAGEWQLLVAPDGRFVPPQAAGALAWSAVFFTGAALLVSGRKNSVAGKTIASLVVSAMLAVTAAHLFSGTWAGWHVLLTANAASAAVALAVGARIGREPIALTQTSAAAPPTSTASTTLEYSPPPAKTEFSAPGRSAIRWATAIGAAVVLQTLRGALTDPGRPIWTAGPIAAVSLLAIAIACWRPARGFIFISAALYNLAASLWWLHYHALWPAGAGIDLFNFNLIVLAVQGLAWLVIELQILAPRGLPSGRWRSFHSVAAMLSLAGVLLMVALTLAGDPLPGMRLLADGAISATAALLAACLWDPDSIGALPGLYLLALATEAFAIDQTHVRNEQWWHRGSVLLAIHVLVTSVLVKLRDLLPRWNFPPRSRLPAVRWLAPANVALAASVIILAFCADFAPMPLRIRLAIATGAALQCLAIALLASPKRQSGCESASIFLAALGAVAWAWAWLPTGPADELLNRLALAMTVLLAISGACAAILRSGSEPSAWSRAARQMLPGLAGATLLLLLLTLGAEIWERYTTGHLWIAPAATAAVGAAIVLGMIGAILLAVLPRSPLSPRLQAAAVYAAEALLALLLVHLRLTMPWLFGGVFQQYWPLVVLLVAFLGVALGEHFRRRGRSTLAGPLQNTGAFLPLLPAIGFWTLSSNVNYSLLLLLVGLVYSALAILRKSFGFGLLAAIAANAALWYRLDHLPGMGLLQHPQFWLIPASLSVLAAAHLNRARLSPAQMQSIRYICLMLIYVSSTADMFINGIARSPALALVLGTLSVAGVLAGMLLRIRSFLYLGAAFLTLTILTIIWHAGVDLHQTWLIWLTGIAAGAAIILVFALFEKKRGEILAMMDHLKHWQG